MNENESTNRSEPQTSDSGGGSQQRRRRRRRSRRRSSDTRRTESRQSPQQGSSAGGEQQRSKTSGGAPDAEGTTSSRSSRRRRRRGGQGAKNTSQNRQKQGASKNRSKSRSSSQRGRSRRGRHRDGPRMETRNETSAGGLVISGLAEAVNPDTKEVDLTRVYVALIGRLDRRGRLLWSMPKGHVEEGEDHARTAEREVWEETGIYGEVIADLGVIDYWFVSDGVRIHKTVHHHLLRYVDGILNDEDPEVTEVAWIPASELIERLAYADERRLARNAHDQLPDLARAEHEAGRTTPR